MPAGVRRPGETGPKNLKRMILNSELDLIKSYLVGRETVISKQGTMFVQAQQILRFELFICT